MKNTIYRLAILTSLLFIPGLAFSHPQATDRQGGEWQIIHLKGSWELSFSALRKDAPCLLFSKLEDENPRVTPYPFFKGLESFFSEDEDENPRDLIICLDLENGTFEHYDPYKLNLIYPDEEK